MMKHAHTAYLHKVFKNHSALFLLTAFSLSITACTSGDTAINETYSESQLNTRTVPNYSGDIEARDDIEQFIFIGDTQMTSIWERLIRREVNDSARSVLMNRIAEEDPAFLAIVGDLVFQGDDARHWKRFDDVLKPVRAKGIPLRPLLGNHDYYGRKRAALRHFHSRFPHFEDKLWYNMQFRSTAIIFLNSNFKKLGQELTEHQNTWYRILLEQYQNDPSVSTIIVACHHPPYTNSTITSDDSKVQNHFVQPFMDTPKAKLFISGHCHAYEHFLKEGKHFIVSGGGGGPRQKLLLGDKKRHDDLYNGGEIREFHFCRISEEDGTLLLEMVKMDASFENWSVGDTVLLR